MTRGSGDAPVRARLIVLAIGGAIGAGLIGLITRSRPDFEAWILQDVRSRSQLVLVAMIVLTTGPLLLTAGYLWSRGNRPQIHRPLSVVLGASGVVLAVLLWRVVSLLTSAAR